MHVALSDGIKKFFEIEHLNSTIFRNLLLYTKRLHSDIKVHLFWSFSASLLVLFAHALYNSTSAKRGNSALLEKIQPGDEATRAHA